MWNESTSYVVYAWLVSWNYYVTPSSDRKFVRPHASRPKRSMAKEPTHSIVCEGPSVVASPLMGSPRCTTRSANITDFCVRCEVLAPVAMSAVR
jgi:hypothetical protein